MNHAEYQKKCRTKTEAELRYIIKDAGEAIEANPTGHKAGDYQDEIHYCAAEIRRRNIIILRFEGRNRG